MSCVGVVHKEDAKEENWNVVFSYVDVYGVFQGTSPLLPGVEPLVRLQGNFSSCLHLRDHCIAMPGGSLHRFLPPPACRTYRPDSLHHREQTEVMVISESPETDTPSPAATPAPAAPTAGTPAPAAPTTGNELEAGAVGTVTASSDLYDANLSAAGGCDPAGCIADLTRVSPPNTPVKWSNRC